VSSPPSERRPRFDIADIVREHRAALEAEYVLTLEQRRVLSAIALCRTVALGGHVDVCRQCGHEHPAYNSCRNRHCPKCQVRAQEQWIRARSERVLPVKHFHVVFTLPSELRALAMYRPRPMFSALFAAAHETLLELGASRLGVTLGITSVLHTWTRDLRFHPHLHALVTAGGLSLDGSRWINASAKYLFPVEVMGTLLRGKVMDALRNLHVRGELDGFEDFRDPQGFDRLMTRLAKTSWVVYAKRPFKRVEHVLKYLGRYTHRVGITNSRFVDVRRDAVTFRTKEGKTTTLRPVEFLRRFVQHVLPDGLKKIRHCGLYASANVETKLAQARMRLSVPTILAPVATGGGEASDDLDSVDELLVRAARENCCRMCGGPVERRPLPEIPLATRDTS
jgi:hypothetical protein